MMTKLLVYNHKVIRGDLDPQRNQIKEGYFLTNKKMVEWQKKRLPAKGIMAGGFFNNVM